MVGLIFLFMLILVPLYFLPTIIAISVNHPHKVPIILINLFLGIFGGIGWVVALIWCAIEPSRPVQPMQSSGGVAGEIEQLHQLKMKGVLSQAEFDSKKQAMLSGSSAVSAFCAGCGNKLGMGMRFCNQCGAQATS